MSVCYHLSLLPSVWIPASHTLSLWFCFQLPPPFWSSLPALHPLYTDTHGWGGHLRSVRTCCFCHLSELFPGSSQSQQCLLLEFKAPSLCSEDFRLARSLFGVQSGPVLLVGALLCSAILFCCGRCVNASVHMCVYILITR